MDPRPYHFQFRKPRYQNPTFRSNNLYDSIYQLSNQKSAGFNHKNPQTYRYYNNENKKPQSQPDMLKRRNQSMELPKAQKLQLNHYPSKVQYNVSSKQKAYPSQNQKNGSKLSNYGYNLMKAQSINKNQHITTVDQTQVFDKQQHAFDIINYRPTAYRARLKMYPRLTLQDKLNQRFGSPLKQDA